MTFHTDKCILIIFMTFTPLSLLLPLVLLSPTSPPGQYLQNSVKCLLEVYRKLTCTILIPNLNDLILVALVSQELNLIHTEQGSPFHISQSELLIICSEMGLSKTICDISSLIFNKEYVFPPPLLWLISSSSRCPNDILNV